MKVKWDRTLEETEFFASVYSAEDESWQKPLLQVVKVKPSKARQPWRWRVRDLRQPGAPYLAVGEMEDQLEARLAAEKEVRG
jgi:hypothetical protein